MHEQPAKSLGNDTEEGSCNGQASPLSTGCSSPTSSVPQSKHILNYHSNGKQDGFNREAGYSLFKDMLQGKVARNGGEVTAVFVASDVQAIGALGAARELGVRVPDDIVVVGFDDIELAKHAQLTTMRRPMYKMGTIAVQMLTHRMNNPDAPPNHSTFVPELVIRKTCGAVSSDRSLHPASGGNIELEAATTWQPHGS